MKKIASELKSPNVSLRARMLTVLLIAGIPGIIVAIFLTVHKFSEETSQIETSVRRLAALGAAQHEGILTNARTLLQAIANAHPISNIGQVDCRTYLKDWNEEIPYFTSLTLFNTSGTVVCTNLGGELPYTAKGESWFSDAVEKKIFTLSDYNLGRNGKALLIAALPVIGENNNAIGVAALGITLTWLQFVSQTIELPKEGSITAVGPEGNILSHHGTDQESIASPPAKAGLEVMTSRASGTYRGLDLDGSTRVYGFQKTKLGGITVIVGLPQFVQYAEWSNALVHTLFSPLFVLILTLLAAAWASEALVVRHVRSLIGTADEIASGNLEARSEVDYGEHELGELAAAVDSMAAAIEQSHLEIERKSADYELIAREMQHRITNNLAIAQFIAYRTNQFSKTSSDFREAFSARINALSVSNRLLLEGNWKSADVRETLETVLEMHLDDGENRIRLSGPALRLDTRATLSLSLTVHELATNAVKYGALSQPGGKVNVSWAVIKEDGRNWLEVEWRETGGPAPEPAAKAGFGSQLMRMMIVDRLAGRLEQRTEGTGHTCCFAFPLPDRDSRSDVDGTQTTAAGPRLS